MQRHSYLIRRNYGHHQNGTKCFALRQNSKLKLEFENGETIELPGNYYNIENFDNHTIDSIISDDLTPLFNDEDDSFIVDGQDIGPLNELIMANKHWSNILVPIAF